MLSQQTVHFFQSDTHAVIPNKLAFTSLHCSISNYTFDRRDSDLINLRTNTIQISIRPKHLQSATTNQIRPDLRRAQTKHTWFDRCTDCYLINTTSTAPISFSQSRGLWQAFPSLPSPSPSPVIPFFFCSRPVFSTNSHGNAGYTG